jgi:hypothetical protein
MTMWVFGWGLVRRRRDHLGTVSAWSTVALSLGSAGIGATAALTVTTMQLRNATASRERAERAARRDRAAGVLGRILGVLDDMEPGIDRRARRPERADGREHRPTLVESARRPGRVRRRQSVSADLGHE